MHPQIDKKRFLLGDRLFDEGDGVFGIFVHRHLFTGAVEGTVFVVAIFAGQRRVGDHVVGEMPFSEVGSAVAGALQETGQ